LRKQKNNKRSLRERIEDKKNILVLPGVYDALTAKIAESVGFDAMFQTGYGSAASLLGMPDYGFLNAGETIDNATRIIRSVNSPVIVDIDTGYGNPLTVWKLVRDLESIGAAGVFIEDQLWPKRCGHMQGKDVIEMEEYISKLRAALEARKSKDFIIVARTDSRAPLGIDESIRRGKAYREMGADVIFIEAPRSIAELRRIADEIDAPLVANMIEDGITPNLNAKRLLDLGYRIAVFPLSGLYAATYAVDEVFTELRKNGSTTRLKKIMTTFDNFNRLVNLQMYQALEKKYKTVR
jgi:carboxyvinyl-carboxyphosphonate phosphorylmutase